ncbi:MAG: FKBP-type peptidyl-prolyl cis-trans isomerase [Saprospiraceae bacterium]|nr:FKBP-type peptidyl-prolyl cis-trans isomerase [Saprospiraceae bacterium]
MKYCLTLVFAMVFQLLDAQTPAMTTEHGYRFYHHIKKGGQQPKRGETIKAFVNVFIGDTLLSSSRKNLGGAYKYDIPAADATPDHVPPIMDAVLLMGIGDSGTIFQPVDSTMRNFLPKAVQNEPELRFEIALAQIISEADKAKAEQATSARIARLKVDIQNKIKEYNGGLLNDKITTNPSGLKMLILTKGPGKPIKSGEVVQVHYFGFLPDGTMFDNSFEKRHPLTFPAGVGQMMAGFDEGLLNLNKGGRAYLFIPNKLAYGDEAAAGGLIPPKSDLIFYIEVL